MVQSSSFINCNVCEKRFSGPEPYQAHLNSAKHKKKAGTLQDPSPSPDGQMLHCDVCNVNISGPIPYAQHMEGSKHKSQVNKKQIASELSASTSSESEPASLYPNLGNIDSTPSHPDATGTAVVVHKCELCGVCFSGPENMKEHLESKGHKRKLELEKWKPVLGQNLVPASAPPIQDNDASVITACVNAVGDHPVPEPLAKLTEDKQQPVDQEQPKKHKKPMGCFKLRCFSARKLNKDEKKEVGLVY